MLTIRCFPLCFFLVSVFFPSFSEAQCTASSDGTWTAPATWSGCGGGTPVAGSDAVVDGNGTEVTFTMTADVTINSLTLTDATGNPSNSRTLRLSGPFTLMVTNDLSVGVRANLILSGGAKIVVLGDLISGDNGNVDIDGAAGGGAINVLGCYRVGNGNPAPNIFSNIDWCVQGCGQIGAGGNSCDAFLPVTLVSFDLWEENGKVVLEWETAQEIDNAYFAVERSRNGRDFEEILRLPGSENTSLPITYRAEDAAPLSGQTYYRLRQTDVGGSFSFSKIRSVTVFLSDFKLFPNPSETGEFRLLSPSENIISYEIRDLRGIKIYGDNFAVARSEFHSKPEQKLGPALYFVRIGRPDGSFKMLRLAVR